MIHAFTDNSKATWNDYIPDLGNCPQTNRPRLHDELVCVWQRQTETDKDKGREREEEVEMGGFSFQWEENRLVFITMNTAKHIPNMLWMLPTSKLHAYYKGQGYQEASVPVPLRTGSMISSMR